MKQKNSTNMNVLNSLNQTKDKIINNLKEMKDSNESKLINKENEIQDLRRS